MATERQIEANRSNARRSSGPRTEAGKATSRLNALKHGLAAELTTADREGAEAGRFADRREAWSDELRPEGERGSWALDRAVAASIRIERCEAAFHALVVDDSSRAALAWDLDRRADAAMLAGRLGRDPARVQAQLETTRHGVDLMARLWDRLIAALDAAGDWSAPERSLALDLLGLPAGLRTGRTPLDPPGPTDDLAGHLRGLAAREAARLRRNESEALAPLDDLGRRQAEAGVTTLVSKPARLIFRYEGDAWRRYRAAIRDLQAPDDASPVTERDPDLDFRLPSEAPPARKSQPSGAGPETRRAATVTPPTAGRPTAPPASRASVALGAADESDWSGLLSAPTSGTSYVDIAATRPFAPPSTRR